MITHVAIRVGDRTWALPAPNRHHDVIRMIHEETGEMQREEWEQGFLDDQGRFLRRGPALLYAIACKQLKPDELVRADVLFSENLW